jgi:hypothetical protein
MFLQSHTASGVSVCHYGQTMLPDGVLGIRPVQIFEHGQDEFDTRLVHRTVLADNPRLCDARLSVSVSRKCCPPQNPKSHLTLRCGGVSIVLRVASTSKPHLVTPPPTTQTSTSPIISMAASGVLSDLCDTRCLGLMCYEGNEQLLGEPITKDSLRRGLSEFLH